MLATLAIVGGLYIPNIASTALRWLAWSTYGFLQGLVFVGLWELAHQMGHGALFPSRRMNDMVGFVIHSFELTPYFAWHITHAKHHHYTVHMQKDPNHIPSLYNVHDATVEQEHQIHPVLNFLDDWFEDAPLYALMRLMFRQILGWPLHVAISIAAGAKSCDHRSNSLTTWMPDWLRKSQINPFGSHFRHSETFAVIVSDIGLAATMTMLYKFTCAYGLETTFLLYGQPWMWLNHWITAVTFLQHTHPDVPKFEEGSWTWIKGATSTIDRDLGFIGTFFFHNVVPYHVVHHLFPRIPFYHTPEASRAIEPLLGESFNRDHTPFYQALWREFRQCQWMVSDNAEKPEDRALWFMDRNGTVLSKKSTAKSTNIRKRHGVWW